MLAFPHVIVTAPRFDGADGISAVARQFVSVFEPDRDCRLSFWSYDETERPAALDPRVEFRGAGGDRVRFGSFGVWPGLRDSDVLVVALHVHLAPVMLPLVMRGARLVLMLHGIEVWKPLRRFERTAVSRAWRVIANSAYTVTRFRENNPALQDVPVSVCHLAAPDATAPSAGRLVDRPFALIVGRMAAAERYKGHDLLLDVWPRVMAAVPGAMLVIAGDGDDRARLEARARAAGLESHVRFLGRVSDSDLAALYRDAQMFVMPSRDEGFGLVFLEAMRARTPCIAAHGAADELFDDGVEGFLVGAEDRDAVVERMVRLFTDQDLRRRMGEASAARVAGRLTRAAFLARIASVIDPAGAPVTC